jgi:hypothetical protein
MPAIIRKVAALFECLQLFGVLSAEIKQYTKAVEIFYIKHCKLISIKLVK